MPRVHNTSGAISHVICGVPKYVYDELRSIVPEEYLELSPRYIAKAGAKMVLESWYASSAGFIGGQLSLEVVRNMPKNKQHLCIEFSIPREVWNKIDAFARVLDTRPNIAARFLLIKWAEKRIAKREGT